MKHKLPLFLVAIAVIAGVTLYQIQQNNQPEEEPVLVTTEREVRTVGSLGGNSEALVGFGQVVSADSVTVVPELSGVVKQVYKNLGDTVQAGETVVELQNLTEQQSVLQAQSQLSSAQANLAKANRGAESDQIAQAQAQVTLQQSALSSTEAQTLTSIDGFYSYLDGLLITDYNSFFDNVNGNNSRFIEELESEAAEFALGDERDRLEDILDGNKNFDDIDRALDTIAVIFSQFKQFAGTIRTTINELEPDAQLSEATLERWDEELIQTQNKIQSKETELASLRAGLASAQSSVISAEQTLIELQNGVASEDLTIARANVSAAQSQLAAAQIQLAKTFIKAPTFGRISTIDARTGQLVGPSSLVFQLASTGAKRVDVFISSEDSSRIVVGSSVRVDGQYDATVGRIAPAVDSQTGKVKVEIFLQDQDVTLVEGAGVDVQIATSQTAEALSVPIDAVFVRGEEVFVYVLDAENRAVPRTITVQNLIGEQVVVTSGLEGEDRLVLYARGVSDNQVITPRSN